MSELLFKSNHVRKPDLENKGKLVDDYWSPGQQVWIYVDTNFVSNPILHIYNQMLGDIKFLDTLRTYEKDNIPPEIMKKIREKYSIFSNMHSQEPPWSKVACQDWLMRFPFTDTSQIPISTQTSWRRWKTKMSMFLRVGQSLLLSLSAEYRILTVGQYFLGKESNNQNGNFRRIFPWMGGVSSSTYVFWKMIFYHRQVI